MKLQDLSIFINRRILGRALPESVFFYTLHKCASTLFAQHLLKHARRLRYVDYASEIYNGLRTGEAPLEFREHGHLYGPIRLSNHSQGPVQNLMTSPCSKADFIRDKTAVFLIRDPRDILVSAYYSFGFTHRFSNVKIIRDQEKRKRGEIQRMTIDEYVIAKADTQASDFNSVHKLSEASARGVVLRYEDMIHDYKAFAKKLTQFIPLDKNALEGLHQRSRPRKTEAVDSHRRSGKTGSFADKLRPETIDVLNHKLEEALERFGYRVV